MNEFLIARQIYGFGIELLVINFAKNSNFPDYGKTVTSRSNRLAYKNECLTTKVFADEW